MYDPAVLLKYWDQAVHLSSGSEERGKGGSPPRLSPSVGWPPDLHLDLDLDPLPRVHDAAGHGTAASDLHTAILNPASTLVADAASLPLDCQERVNHLHTHVSHTSEQPPPPPSWVPEASLSSVLKTGSCRTQKVWTLEV